MAGRRRAIDRDRRLLGGLYDDDVDDDGGGGLGDPFQITRITVQTDKSRFTASILVVNQPVHGFCDGTFIFYARQHAERAICYRKSVCLSVTRVDQSKTVELSVV